MSLKDERYEQAEQEQHDESMAVYAALLLLLEDCQKDINRELSDFYRKYGQDGVITYEEARKYAGKDDRRKRMVIIFMAIASIMGRLFDNMHSVSEKHFKDVVKREFRLHGIEVDDATIETVLSTKWQQDYGKGTWDSWLNGYKDIWTLRLNNDLKTAFHTGNDIDDVIDDYNIRFKSMEKLLKKFIITATTAVAMTARRIVFRREKIKRYRWYTRMDERVCEYCGALHGVEFPMSDYQIGVTAPPLHARCRCFTVEIK